ncbi:hypothetical protein TSUD_294060 [Trifolium subterraneum]|uniref:Uncharacterized protein n=1 Tax=Trifolium subterraneum TaxID=3900 RepID=A0A2Z6MRY4_TRISU|nr:hypothetical protein TSUD_294060 [Trifolium subterraneum]
MVETRNRVFIFWYARLARLEGSLSDILVLRVHSREDECPLSERSSPVLALTLGGAR